MENVVVPAPDAFSLSEGAVFHDQYEVVRRIDSGAMGTVYEVLDRRTKRRRALKVMLARFVDNTDVTERFRREATITADVVSEHVVETYDAGVDGPTGLPFLVMELLRGEDLGKLIARGPLPAFDVVTLLMQASSALDRMHAAGIVHRDLKPENLFIARRDDGAPRLKILDFGIAKVVEKHAPSATSTRNMGTPVYMSPEQVMGSGNVGPAADLYAVGHLAYTMLTGEPYWLQDALAFETVYPLLLRIMDGATEPASVRAERNKQVRLPPRFDAWFARATAHASERRFKTSTSSIIALADALEIPRPMLGSWPIDQILANAPTLSPPAKDAGAHSDSAASHSESAGEPIPLVPRAPAMPRGEAARDAASSPSHREDADRDDAAHAKAAKAGHDDAHAKAGHDDAHAKAGHDDASAKAGHDAARAKAPRDGGEDARRREARKEDAVRTLSPVSTLPEPRSELAPPGPRRSRNRALVLFGAAFFLTGVLGAVFIARSLRHQAAEGSALAAVPSGSSITAAPPLTSTAPLVSPTVPVTATGPTSAIAPTAEPPSPTASDAPITSAPAPTASEAPSASTSAPAPSASAHPSATRLTGPRKPPRNSKTTPTPSRPYGDPTRDL